MPGATGALYEPLIERDVDAIPAAARAFLDAHSPEELWTAVARFAVLAYAPSQHAKRAVMAVRAAHDVREELGAAWVDMIVACARYAAESRPPWSEPPILDDVAIDESRLENITNGDALLMLDTARALLPLLGEKGRGALLRMPLEEPGGDEVSGSLEELVDRAIASRGAVDDVRAVLIAIVMVDRRAFGVRRPESPLSLHRATPMPLRGKAATRVAALQKPYHLARDYAQTLIAHAFASRLGYRADEFLAAVHHNLEQGENFAEWSFA